MEHLDTFLARHPLIAAVQPDEFEVQRGAADTAAGKVQIVDPEAAGGLRELEEFGRATQMPVARPPVAASRTGLGRVLEQGGG